MLSLFEKERKVTILMGFGLGIAIANSLPLTENFAYGIIKEFRNYSFISHEHLLQAH